MFHVLERYRVIKGPLSSDETYGNNGCFIVKRDKRYLHCIVSDGADWEHVSVSLDDRTPRWNEMCMIKALFWDEEDAVIQIHPPKKDYVNHHPYCLHLWRKCGTNDFYDKPPSILVGPKD